MKNKKFLAILLVTILAISIFAGCDVITKNEERDFNQEIAVINYNGLQAAVTKGEFIESFNSLAYAYVTYYGYTVEETAQFIIDSLAQRKLLVLYVREYISSQQGKDITVPVKDLLTATEINEAIKATNKNIKSAYDSTFSGLWEEYLNANKEAYYEKYPDLKPAETTEEQTKPTDTVRPARPEKGEETVNFDNETVADEDKAVPFFEMSNHYEDNFTEEQKIVSDKAIAQLKKSLANSYRSYDYFLDNSYESQLLAKFQRMMGEGFDIDNEGIKLLIESKRNEYIAFNKEAFALISDSAYTSALNSLNTLVYHPVSERGYGYVYNILFKFSDEQTEKLTEYKKQQNDTDIINAYRNFLAQDIVVKVTNPKYDPDNKVCVECSDDNDETVCTNPTCPSKMYTRELNAIMLIDEIKAVLSDIEAENLTAANDKLSAAYIELNLHDIDGIEGLSDHEKFVLKREVITNYLYLANDDPGMYVTDKNNVITGNGNGYLISPEGKSSTYVKEFTDLGRSLVNGGLGTYDYCVTDYGIHFMFTSYIVYDETRITGDDLTNGYLPLDYIVYYGRYDDPSDTDKTLAQSIFATLESKNLNDKYKVEAQGSINKYKNDAIVINQKIWEKLLKEINKSSK